MNIDDILTKVEFHKGHRPVMVREIIEFFAPLMARENLRYFDGTFGRGGHFRALLACAPQMKSLVMDQDVEAVQTARSEFQTLVQEGSLEVQHQNFSEFSVQEHGLFDMMLVDLGVSSPQLDQGNRGFSFYHDGPLDMRMDQRQQITAEYVLNTSSEDDLNRLFKEWGEVQRPFRVVRAIVHDRKTKAFQTTSQLAGLIERVDGWRQKGQHPATKYFMALRLAVNNELGVLEETLPKFIQALKPGGRLCVLSFHSLEDRIVKNIFKSATEDGRQVHKKVIVPSDEECGMNGRARSAKLRVFERGVQDEQDRFDSN